MQTIRCCDADRQTVFCPDCGRTLQTPSPLFALLQHCRGRATSVRGEIARRHDWGEQGMTQSRQWERRLQTRLAKWEGWCKALSEVTDEARRA